MAKKKWNLLKLRASSSPIEVAALEAVKLVKSGQTGSRAAEYGAAKARGVAPPATAGAGASPRVGEPREKARFRSRRPKRPGFGPAGRAPPWPIPDAPRRPAGGSMNPARSIGEAHARARTRSFPHANAGARPHEKDCARMRARSRTFTATTSLPPP